MLHMFEPSLAIGVVLVSVERALTAGCMKESRHALVDEVGQPQSQRIDFTFQTSVWGEGVLLEDRWMQGFILGGGLWAHTLNGQAAAICSQRL